MDTSFLKNDTIAVLMGGPGAEREVSLSSGRAVAGVLRDLGLWVIAIELSDRRVDLPREVTFVMNMIHGTFGEDGELQALLEQRGLPYSGAGVSASQLAIDKIASKKRFLELGLPTAPFEILQPGAWPALLPPFVLKAPREGSALGVAIIKEADDEKIQSALQEVRGYGEGREILVEEFFQGRELTVGILGEEALPIVEIKPKDGLYNYENRYSADGSVHLIPAPLDVELTREIQTIALQAHHALGIEVYSRVDMMLGDDGRIALLEINTIPGMTPTSLLPDAARVRGLDFGALCLRIIELSLSRFPVRSK